MFVEPGRELEDKDLYECKLNSFLIWAITLVTL